MYLQTQQAADLLGVSRQWVWELVKRQELNTREVAGRPFILNDRRFKALKKKREKLKEKALPMQEVDAK